MEQNTHLLLVSHVRSDTALDLHYHVYILPLHPSTCNHHHDPRHHQTAIPTPRMKRLHPPLTTIYLPYILIRRLHPVVAAPPPHRQPVRIARFVSFRFSSAHLVSSLLSLPSPSERCPCSSSKHFLFGVGRLFFPRPLPHTNARPVPVRSHDLDYLPTYLCVPADDAGT